MNVVAGRNEPAPVLAMLIVSPVEVRIAVRVDIRKVGVAVRIDPRKLYIQYHPCHHPLNTLWVVLYSEPKTR